MDSKWLIVASKSLIWDSNGFKMVDFSFKIIDVGFKWIQNG